MSVAVLSIGPRADRSRTRWSMTASAVLHALVLALIIFVHPAEPGSDPITEITLLDAGEPGSPAPAATPAPAPQPSSGAAVEHTQETRFTRAPKAADIAPSPQLSTATDDRLNARLAALQSREVATPMSAGGASPTSLWGTAPANAATLGAAGSSPIALHRGGAGAGPALELARGAGAGTSGWAAAAPRTEPQEASEPARGGGSTAQRTLAGATIIGPIADRPVVNVVRPEYPDWAKQEGVEGSVSIYFVVSPDGTIRENVLVQKTSGFEDFDENARAALRQWRFQPLRGGRTGDQWGTITFHFRLRDGG